MPKKGPPPERSVRPGTRALTTEGLKARGLRSTRTSQSARASARGTRVAEAAAALLEAAERHPGSYAGARSREIAFHRDGNPRKPRSEVDHIPTDWSQRGPGMARGAKKNAADTLQRPAARVPAALHRAHPTTLEGHDAGTVASAERLLQTTGGREGVDYAPTGEGRMDATQLHLVEYAQNPLWRSMKHGIRKRVREDFEKSLAETSVVRDDSGGRRTEVALSTPQRGLLMDAFDISTGVGSYPGTSGSSGSSGSPAGPARARSSAGSMAGAGIGPSTPASATPPRHRSSHRTGDRPAWNSSPGKASSFDAIAKAEADKKRRRR